jgi:hypothetical protein
MSTWTIDILVGHKCASQRMNDRSSHPQITTTSATAAATTIPPFANPFANISPFPSVMVN